MFQALLLTSQPVLSCFGALSGNKQFPRPQASGFLLSEQKLGLMPKAAKRLLLNTAWICRCVNDDIGKRVISDPGCLCAVFFRNEVL